MARTYGWLAGRAEARRRARRPDPTSTKTVVQNGNGFSYLSV